MRSFFLTIFLSLSLTAGTLTRTIIFEEKDFEFKKIDGYDLVILPGESNITIVGAPLLPKKSLTFVIPPDAEVTNVKIIDKTELELPGEYDIFPAQQPIFLSHPELYKFTPPDKKIYTRDEPYPENYFSFYPSGVKSGFRLVGIDVYPLHYVPAQKKLVLTKKITIQIKYVNNVHPVISLSDFQYKTFAPGIADLVLNTDDISRFSPRICQRTNTISYVIITSDSLANSFQALLKWRTKQGWKAELKTTTWIYTNYPGYDNPERIRNFIKDYFINRGLVWVLIGGDVDIVPVRLTYLPEAHSPYSDWVASDLYYADLDGSWDANNNHIYGEFSGDSVDLYPDIFLGRIPVNTQEQVINYISKEDTFVKNPPTGYLKKILLPSVMLVPQINYHGRVVNNAIADIVPTDWYNGKIEDPASGRVKDSLVAGYQFCHLATHGDYDGFYYANGNPVFHISEVPYLANSNKYNIMNSIACLTGNFDEHDCMAESLINKYPGACVATILNTRLGVGYRGCLGPSELLDLKFYEIFFNANRTEISYSHNLSKDVYHNDILNEPHWRYCGYELTLFGDPALSMWQDAPTPILVNHPSRIPLGSSYFEVKVKKGIFPISNALVCLMGKIDTCLYGVGYTNSSGIASIPITASVPLDTMWVTVTASNHYSYESFVIVDSGMPTMPEIISPFNYARLPDLQPRLTFYSVDPQGDDIQYRILWDSDPNFATPESITTNLAPSGDTINYVFSAALTDGETYWWRVKSTDPAGSTYWTQYTPKRSFTIDTKIPEGTCSWFQTTGAQFILNTFSGTMVQGDSVILVPYGQTIFDTILKENFESGSIPSGWTIIDGNNDNLKWGVGQSIHLAPLWHPPNYQSKYAFFQGDTNNMMTNNEELVSPPIYTGDVDSGLWLTYSYTWAPQGDGDYRVKMRKKIGNEWGPWVDIKIYSDCALGVEAINLTSYLPADSMQFEWFYKDNSLNEFSGICACDNVVVYYPYAPVNNYGTLTGVGVKFHDLSLTQPRMGWGSVVWHKSTSEDSIGIQIEYKDSAGWHLIPENILPGNMTGFFTHLTVDTVKLTNVDTTIYNTLRLKALFYRRARSSGNPALLDWEIGNLSGYIGVGASSSGAAMSYFVVSPNPFKEHLMIKFTIRNPKSEVSLKIYDVTGRLIKTFSLSTFHTLPATSVEWDGTDNGDKAVPQGIYFVELKTKTSSIVRKIVKIK